MIQIDKLHKNYFWSLGLLLIVGCDGFFGKKTDLDFIDIPEYLPRDVAYVPVEPVIKKYQNPIDIIAGFDELIYVVDGASEEIISLDESGRELGRFQLNGVKSIAQNRKLDLLAIGSSQRIVGGVTKDITCIYRIDMHGNGNEFGIEFARVVDTIAHPLYFKSTFSGSDDKVEFNKIAVLEDNRFYVTRSGIDNNPQKFGGPDYAVLLMNRLIFKLKLMKHQRI